MAKVTVDAGKLNVFISYSRDDLAFADQLGEALALCGFATTLDRQGIAGGEDWRRRLGNLIREADTVVFVLSPSSGGDGDIVSMLTCNAPDTRRHVQPSASL